MSFIGPLLLFSAFTIGIRASTHWMVTENGLIQPRLDSPFEMANPYDVLAFLNQDTRWENINNMYHDLAKRKDSIRKLWRELGTETDIQTHLSTDKNCVKAGTLDSFDWYASLLEDGRARNIAEEDVKLYNPYYGQDTDVPDCKKISSLTFSMFTFEHLEAMAQRENLTANPELALPEHVSPTMNIEQLGHWVANTLRHNSSSWLHYNMASLYWRVRGNAPKALECSRRAVHYAPRKYKDLALLSLGTIFHRCQKTEDALIVLNAAVDHNHNYASSQFVLANAYAVSGDFNNSLKHLNSCLKSNPNFDLAQKHRYGILCHRVLKGNMKNIHRILDRLKIELVVYSDRETEWLKSQASFLRTMKHYEDFDFRNVEKNCDKMAELTGLHIKELKREGDKNSLIQYFLDGPMYRDDWDSDKGIHAIKSVFSLQRLVKHIEKHASLQVAEVVSSMPDQLVLSDGMIKKEIGPMPEFTDEDPLTIETDPIRGRIVIDGRDYMSEPKVNEKAKPGSSVENDHFEFEGGIVLYPPTLKLSRNLEDFDKDHDWPTTRFCAELSQRWPKNLDAIHPVFLPFENKGIRLKTLLTDMIGVPADREHDLPWHPPTCTTDKDTTFTLKKNQKPQVVVEVAPTQYLKYKLLEYIGNGNVDAVKHMQDAEIGQRIYAAIEMEIAPKWLLHTLASLYWRVRGNNVNAINCLLTASKTVPQRHRDVVLTSLASVYLEIGAFDEAMLTAEEAFRLSLYEPATNFIIAQLNMVKRHRNTQLFHLKQVVRVESRFMGGFVRDILDQWACHLQRQFTREMVEISENDICTQVEPGVSMVCEKDGTNCHMTNVECFHARSAEGSTLIHYLELKSHKLHSSSVDEHIDPTVFDPFIASMPPQRSDLIGHQRNFDRMRLTMDAVLKGCGDRGCKSIQPEDLSMSEDDCSYQHLQMAYWLGYKQLLADANIDVPIELLALPASENTVPQCSIPVETYSDFVLERISRVDMEGWEPVVEMMQHFAETFDFYDYVTLGAKISKYVETRPKDWLALMTAAWWCGTSGNGYCAARCILAAVDNTPRTEPLLALAELLNIQSKLEDAKDIAYLMFYMTPKSKMEAFLVAVTHTNLLEYEQAVWMYRYSLTFDEKFLPAKACLHATMCLMLFGDKSKLKLEVK